MLMEFMVSLFGFLDQVPGFTDSGMGKIPDRTGIFGFLDGDD